MRALPVIAGVLLGLSLAAGCGTERATDAPARGDAPEAERADSSAQKSEARARAKERRRARRAAAIRKWKREFTNFRIDMEDASGRLTSSFYAEYFSAAEGAYLSKPLVQAEETLWNCAHRLGRIGPARTAQLRRAREGARQACRHYKNAVEAFDQAWTTGQDGLIAHAEDQLFKGDLALDLADPGSGRGGFRPPTGQGDLDCSDVNGPVYVGPNDPHGLDGDGDGVGCE